VGPAQPSRIPIPTSAVPLDSDPAVTGKVSPARTPSERAWRIAGWSFATLMLLTHLWAGWYAAGIPDFWRDVHWAVRIAQGESIPLGGPPIYQVFQLGPWWYVLMALPLLFTRHVIVISLLIQALAASKYFLAYALGARLRDARLGCLMACSLLLAGWGTGALLFPTHTALVEATTLVLALVTLHGWDRWNGRVAACFGLASALAIHAHPSTVPAIVAAGGLLLQRHRVQAVRPMLVSIAIVALSLLPPWLDGEHAASDMIGRVAGYAQAGGGTPGFERIAGLLQGIAIGGAWYGTRFLTRWHETAIDRAEWLQAAAALLAWAGAWVAARESGWAKRLVWGACALVLMQAGFLLLVRPITPVWMVVPTVPALALVLAIGWDRSLRLPGIPRVAVCVTFALALALALVPFGTFLHRIDRFRVPVGANPLMDAAGHTARFRDVQVPYTGIRALQSVSPLLCDGGVLHGRLSVAMERSLAGTVASACGGMPDLRFGGRDEALTHWVGFDRQTWNALGMTPATWVGRLGLDTAVRALAPLVGAMPTRLAPMQVHADFHDRGPGSFELVAETRGDAVIVLSNRSPLDHALAVRGVRADDRALEPVLRAEGSTFYRCGDCLADARVTWRLALDGIAEDLDVVALERTRR